MSNAVFPSLPGLQWPIARTPIWSTTPRVSVSGRRVAIANYSYPRYKFTLSYSFLRQGQGTTDLSQMVGFFNARWGDADSFLFDDVDDNTVTAQTIGVGDGANKLFQLVRTFGGFVEPVFVTNSAPLIYVSGVLKTLTTDYTVSATGLVTFVVAPAAATVVTWTGTYYKRMWFSQSMAEFSKFMSNLWELKKIEIESWKS
ncbi:MAG: DUF2460 domain-containing protein [Betaproteobacteria bacterium]